jgi:hypothetical protein
MSIFDAIVGSVERDAPPRLLRVRRFSEVGSN